MKLRGILSNTIFFIQILLLFLVIVESSVSIPFWLQPLGRIHPLILHFPVVLVLLLFILIFFKSRIEEGVYENIRSVLLLATAFTTSFTALFGFFLSTEGGYSGDLLTLHKWTGVGLSFIVYGLTLAPPSQWLYKSLSTLSVILVVATGHFGATLTHGENFIFEPITTALRPAFNENMPVFEAVINPILDSKCVSCHNPQKHKGDLDLTNWEAIQKGGESGQIFIAGNAAESDIMRRALLPIEHDDHMPPEGKAQLNQMEIQLLNLWINQGADNTKLISDYQPSDSLYQLASLRLNSQKENEKKKTYTFSSASKKDIELLNSHYRSVRQSTMNSPALDVQVFVAQAYSPEAISELNIIKDQIVSLNLSYLPVSDDDLQIVSQFKNLEKLILNYTDISTEGIARLGKLPHLQKLAVAGTAVDDELKNYLSNFESLISVHLWQTKVSPGALSELQNSYLDIIIDEGYVPSKDLTLTITPPILGNKSKIIGKDEPILLEHTIPGTLIYYTTDGSDPDTTSLKYLKPFLLENISPVRTIAFKEGWQPSKVAEFNFYIRGYTPKKATLLAPANQKYQGNGAATLIDNEKGVISGFTAPHWLGFQETNMDVLVDFGASAPHVEHVVIGYGMDMNNYIMKPVKVELWGGNSAQNLRKISTMELPLPKGYEPNIEAGIEINTSGTEFRYYRIVAHPYQVLPEWHVGKGDKGWVFVDELFFY